MEYEEETSCESMQMENMDRMEDDCSSVNTPQQQQQQHIQWQTDAKADLQVKRTPKGRLCKRRFPNLMLKDNRNPYLKKNYAEEIVLSQVSAQKMSWQPWSNINPNL